MTSPSRCMDLLAESVETDAARELRDFSRSIRARNFPTAVPSRPTTYCSWQLLRDRGRPNHRTYYSKVAKAEKLDEREAFDSRSTAAATASCR